MSTQTIAAQVLVHEPKTSSQVRREPIPQIEVVCEDWQAKSIFRRATGRFLLQRDNGRAERFNTDLKGPSWNHPPLSAEKGIADMEIRMSHVHTFVIDTETISSFHP